jgi:hypothetical protein
MAKQTTVEGTEPWYKSRRLWGGISSVVAYGLILFFPEHESIVIQAATIVGALAGISLPILSHFVPKTAKK